MKNCYYDNAGNKATIEDVYIFPYQGASYKMVGYRLTLSAMYDDDFIYHVSVHETMNDAVHLMKTFSCGEWKEMED